MLNAYFHGARIAPRQRPCGGRIWRGVLIVLLGLQVCGCGRAPSAATAQRGQGHETVCRDDADCTTTATPAARGMTNLQMFLLILFWVGLGTAAKVATALGMEPAGAPAPRASASDPVRPGDWSPGPDARAGCDLEACPR